MFYYPAVLNRRTGCFSTIWLVATKGIRVPRRDFLKVNVKSTCDDIMNYVLEQVPPPRPDLPRPRFSLYLSSQLQYGVIVVYHQQCAIFLEELQSVVGQLLKQMTSQTIDMEDGRQTQVLPDALSLLEDSEGAVDPLFGVMHLQDAMLSPNTLIERSREVQREASPEQPEPTSPAVSPAAAAAESGITASPETITLRETEPVFIPTAEFEGVELADHHPDDIVLLLAQTVDFPEGDLEMPREDVTPGEEEREVERERRERDQEKDRTKELTRSPTELQPTAASSEEATLLPQEEMDVSTVEPGPPTDQVTPVSVPDLPSPPSEAEERRRHVRSLESEDVAPLRPKVRRRRQLIFFDPETQLSQEQLQEQISDLLIETRRPPLPPPPSQRLPPAAELFNNPCNFLPEEIQFLWRQAATITPVSGSDLQVGERGSSSSSSETEIEREMMEMAERVEAALDQLPTEVPGEMEEMFDTSAHTLPLEASDQREASREISPVYLSEREGSTVSKSVLQDIPEVMDELPEREEAAAESPGLLPELAEGDTPVLFHSLLPPDANRKTVSNVFHRLLENLSARRVHVEQNEPYGDIMIFPGSRYEVSVV